MSASYIYIDEDGRVGVSLIPPTKTDLLSIGDGRLQVLRCETVASGPVAYGVISEIDEDGLTVEPNLAEIQNEEGDYFHVVV